MILKGFQILDLVGNKTQFRRDDTICHELCHPFGFENHFLYSTVFHPFGVLSWQVRLITKRRLVWRRLPCQQEGAGVIRLPLYTWSIKWHYPRFYYTGFNPQFIFVLIMELESTREMYLYNEMSCWIETLCCVRVHPHGIEPDHKIKCERLAGARRKVGFICSRRETDIPTHFQAI